MARILFVEDEEEVLSTLVKFFQREGFDVQGARGGKAALEIMERFPPDIAILDVMLHEGPDGSNGMNGYEVCKALRDRGFERPVIFLTARVEEDSSWVQARRGRLRHGHARCSCSGAHRQTAPRRRASRSLFKFGDTGVDSTLRDPAARQDRAPRTASAICSATSSRPRQDHPARSAAPKGVGLNRHRDADGRRTC
jgi:CheY-like chemotaxis protein